MYEELIKSLRNRKVCVQTGGDLGQDYPLMREAADVIEELLAWHNADVRELGRQKSRIANMRPVVRGKWIYDIEPDMFRCSECNGFAPRNDYPFCHWCGADMREEEE